MLLNCDGTSMLAGHTLQNGGCIIVKRNKEMRTNIIRAVKYSMFDVVLGQEILAQKEFGVFARSGAERFAGRHTCVGFRGGMFTT